MSRQYWNSSTISKDKKNVQRRHTEVLTQFLNERLKRNVLTDVECIVGGRVFQAHRALLVCFSPYLKSKLLSNDGKPIADKVYIPGIEASEFEVLLQYMYCGELEVNCNNIYEIIRAASLLKMKEAKEECLQLFDGKDDVKTYFYAYVLSKKLGVESNWQKALNLITHRFEETVFTEEFMQLDLQYVLEILSAHEIGARSEVIVFLAALKWLNKDYETHSIDAITVMKCVRFNCMTEEEILACFHPPFLPQVVQIPEVKLMLFRATCYIAAKSKGQEGMFPQYVYPKRNLTMEKLPMKLWHKEYSPSAIFRPRMDSSELYSRKPYTEEPENQHLVPPKETKFEKLIDLHPPDEEESDSSLSLKEIIIQGEAATCDDFKDRRLGKKKVSLDQTTGMDFISASKRKISSPIISRLKDNDVVKLSPTKVKSIPDASQEIQLPGLFHRAKAPVKSHDVKIDAKHAKSQNFLKLPETPVIYEDITIAKKARKKPEDVKLFDSVLTDESKKRGIDKKSLTQMSSGSDESIEEIGCILIIGGMNPRNFTKDSGGFVYIFNVNANKWLPYVSLPEPRHNHCSAVLDNILYVVGGCNSHDSIQKSRYVPKPFCFKLNVDNTEWLSMPSMKRARFDHGIAVYNGCLIVIGGQDEKGRLLKSMEMFDPKQNSWKLLNSDMCCARKAMGVAVYSDRIWIAGGITPSLRDSRLEAISHVDIYHPEEKKWYFNSYLLPSARSHCCLVEWNGKLYCVGGTVQSEKGKIHTTNEVWFIDGENQLWKKGPFLPEPRMGGSVVTYGENLYYLGGCDPDKNSNVSNVIFLIPGAETWSLGPPMTSDLFGLSAVCFTCPRGKQK